MGLHSLFITRLVPVGEDERKFKEVNFAGDVYIKSYLFIFKFIIKIL